ncbi:MAG: cytidylate kinase-like family protein [Clostridia bacterium]|nr:cytidylate kinase-like family protein [Clostridia bacterium]
MCAVCPSGTYERSRFVNTIITIGRQFGSGGHEIGRLLAERLGIPCYDKELITLAAREAGISEEVLARVDETATSSLLYAATAGAYMGGVFHGVQTLPINDRAFLALTDIIRSKAEEGPCVFVGRCADFILRDREPVLNVFVRADLPFRIARIAEGENCSERDAESLIAKADKKRAKYYNFYTQKRWGSSECYDLILNRAKTDRETAISLIISYAQSMATD